MKKELPSPPRELRITSDVKQFLNKCGPTVPGRDLIRDIGRALRGEEPRRNVTLASSTTFCVRVVDPATPDGPERVIVWNGPTDGGIFYDDHILQRTEPSGLIFD